MNLQRIPTLPFPVLLASSLGANHCSRGSRETVFLAVSDFPTPTLTLRFSRMLALVPRTELFHDHISFNCPRTGPRFFAESLAIPANAAIQHKHQALALALALALAAIGVNQTRQDHVMSCHVMA
ncbi:hypothetical protein BJX70DRAFT_127058 [Aspergillus crustosus]